MGRAPNYGARPMYFHHSLSGFTSVRARRSILVPPHAVMAGLIGEIAVVIPMTVGITESRPAHRPEPLTQRPDPEAARIIFLVVRAGHRGRAEHHDGCRGERDHVLRQHGRSPS